jgi:hypothetical protein
MSDKHPTLTLTYEVRAHPHEKGLSIVLRAGKPTGSFGPILHLAATAAVSETRQEARNFGTKVRAVSIVGKERTEEECHDR